MRKFGHRKNVNLPKMLGQYARNYQQNWGNALNKNFIWVIFEFNFKSKKTYKL